jgi:DnaK suppressor protein
LRCQQAAPEALVNTQHYKQRLLELEQTVSLRIERAVADGGRQGIDSARDVGEASVADETADEEFTEAELDSMILKHVREALTRIADGTFGRCLVDGAPIEAKRLDAVPWAPYCLKHQRLIEASARPRTPTL